MLRAIAIDDEPLALELLRRELERISYISLEAQYDNPFEAISRLQSGDIDLIFLDIQMPDISGMEVLASLSRKPMVIITTAFSRYAVESYEIDAVDYLLKPFSFSRLLKAVNKAVALKELHLGRAHKPPAPGFLVVNGGYRRIRIGFPDICFIEGMKDYVKIYTEGSDKPLVCSMNLKAVESRLGEGFLRTHRSYIVAIDKITAYNRHTVFIGARELPLGEAYRDLLFDRLG